MTKQIDMTPTFEASVRMCLVLLENGTEEGKQTARDELLRYGRELDRATAAAVAPKEGE